MSFTLEDSICSNGDYGHHIEEEVKCALAAIYQEQEIRNDETIRFDNDNDELIIQMPDLEHEIHKAVKDRLYNLIQLYVIRTIVDFGDDEVTELIPTRNDLIYYSGIYLLKNNVTEPLQVIEVSIWATDDEEILKKFKEE